MNAFSNEQFSYYLLSQMFHSRNLNNKINRVHENCLHIVYDKNTSSYEEVLEIDNSVSVHHRNIQILATELYKIVNGLSPNIIKDVFPLNNNLSYNTRNRRIFQLHMALKHYPISHQKFRSLLKPIWKVCNMLLLL